MSKPTIEKGIPLRSRNNSRVGSSKWPWREMEVGDSFFAPGYVQTYMQAAMLGCKVLVPPGKDVGKFALRLEKKDGVQGVRAWRIA